MKLWKNVSLITILVALLMLGGVLSVTAAPSNIQAVTFNSPLAYVGQDGNVYITDEFSGPGQAVTSDSTGGPSSQPPFFTKSKKYGQFVWSPDGTMLAFVERTSNSLFLVSSGGSPRVISRAVNSGFPVAFSPDGKEIAYLVQTPQTAGPNNLGKVLQIQAVPTAEGGPRAVGSLVVDPWQCNPTGTDSATLATIDETGSQSGTPLYFKWLTSGFLFSMDCAGRGLALTNGRQVIWQNAELVNPSLSPDGTNLLALTGNPTDPARPSALFLVNLQTGAPTQVSTLPGVDRAVFNGNGTLIIYSTVAPSRVVPGNPNNPVGTQLFGIWPVNGVENVLSLWSQPVDGSSPATSVFKAGGYGVGSITASPNRPCAVFSIVTSMARMIDAINIGAASQAAINLASHAEIVRVCLDNSGVPGTITRGGQPSYGPASQFQAIGVQAVVAANPSLVGADPVIAEPSLVGAPVVGGGAVEPVNPLQLTINALQLTANGIFPTATNTPTAAPPLPPAFQIPSVGGNCPGGAPTRLKVNGKGNVISGGSNRLRSVPSVSTGSVLLTIPSNGVFTVIQGPVCTSDFITWWQVNFNGTVGWSAESQNGFYLLEPFTGTTQPTHTPTSTTQQGTGPTHTPTSAGPTSTRTRTPTPTTAQLNVLSVSARVAPPSSNGCKDVEFFFTFQVTVDVPGTVKYQLERSGLAPEAPQTLNFEGPSFTKGVSYTWLIRDPGTYSMAIHVLSPVDMRSNMATVTLSCP